MFLRSLVLSAALPVLMPALAVAQDVANGQTFGAWSVSCEALGKDRTACILTQRLTRESDGAFIAQMMAFWDREGEKAYMVARVPEGAYLPSGFAIRGEGVEEPVPFIWQSCVQGICEALREVEDNMFEDLSLRSETVLGSFQPRIDMDVFVFRFSMDGMIDGMEALHPSR